MMETCENCGRMIGSLEGACVWQEHAVCSECHQRLSTSLPVAQPSPEIRREPLDVLAEAQRRRVLPYGREHRFGEMPRPPVLVEHTSKRWKGHMLVGGLVACFGSFMCATGCAKGAEHLMWLGLTLLLAGSVWAGVAKCVAWWETG